MEVVAVHEEFQHRKLSGRDWSHLQVWYCAATDAQAWTVQPDGTVRVGRECLTAAGGTAGVG